MYPSSEKIFIKINLISIVVLFTLILAGGIVRSSGSGMGCPDWPKCFDQFVPPSDISQLPANYQKMYSVSREARQISFAHTLNWLGFDEMANNIRKDINFLQPEEFNAAKTWSVYANRLLGVIYSITLIGSVIFSLTYFRTRRKIVWWCLFNLLLVGLHGWLSFLMVGTRLLVWMASLQTILTVAILSISIYTYFLARVWRDRNLLVKKHIASIKILMVGIILLSLIQIGLGTTVSEQVDTISSEMNNLNRSEWIGALGLQFNIHRDVAILVIILNIGLFLMIRSKYNLMGIQFKYVSFVMILLILQIVSGIVLSYLALPPVAQAVHILLATLLFGSQFYLMLLLGRNKLYSRKLA